MQARLLAVLGVILLLGMGLAGCMSQPTFQSAGATEVTAKENLGLATAAAKAWSANASLVGVGGAETSEPDHSVMPADPNVGNGRAVSWSYVFQSPKGEHRAFEVSADGTVISKNESEAANDYGGMYGAYAGAYQSYRTQSSSRSAPLDGWTVDSDSALATAMENATFANAARAPNATLAEGLGANGAPAAWGFLVSTKHTTVLALVNATSGELLGVHDFSRYSFGDAQKYASAKAPVASNGTKPAAAQAEPVQIKDSGTLSTSTPVKEIPFTTTGAVAGRLNLTTVFHGDATDLTWKIMNGSKVLQSGSSSSNFVNGGSDSWSVRLNAPGDYKLVLTARTAQPALPLGSVDYKIGALLLPPS